MMAIFVAANIYLIVFILIALLIRPIMRRLGISYILGSASCLALLCLYFMLRRNLFDSFSALYTFPWPAPQASSSVAALDYSYGTDWNTLLQYIWYAGMGVYVVGLIVHTLLFRRRIGRSSKPAPDHITDAAAQVFKEMKRAELTEKLKSDAEREPTADELAECEKVKLPRLLVSSAVDAPIYFAWRKTLVLPDNVSYTDRQLTFILRYACHLVEHGHIHFSWLFLIAMCAGWFNPLIHLLYRMEQSANAALHDSGLTNGCTPEEKEEYISVLRSLSNPQRCSIHYCLIAGPERETTERIEELTIKKLKDRLLSIAALILVPIFFFGMCRLIQPIRQCPVHEESVFSILGENPARLYSDRLSPIPLISTEEDGMLYGTPHYSTTSNITVDWLNFQYPPDTPSEELEANYQRIYAALTARLGEPDAPPEITPLEVSGVLAEGMDLLLPTWQEDNHLLHHKWTVLTKDGEEAALTLTLYPDGAYKNDEVKGGPYIGLSLH